MNSNYLKGRDLKAGKVYTRLSDEGLMEETFLLLKGVGVYFYLDVFGKDRKWNRRYYDDEIYIRHPFYSTKVGKQLLNLRYGDIIKSWKG